MFLKVLHKTLDPHTLPERAHFLSHLVLETYVRSQVRTGNLLKNPIHTKHVQKKRILQYSSLYIYVICAYFCTKQIM